VDTSILLPPASQGPTMEGYPPYQPRCTLRVLFFSFKHNNARTQKKCPRRPFFSLLKQRKERSHLLSQIHLRCSFFSWLQAGGQKGEKCPRRPFFSLLKQRKERSHLLSQIHLRCSFFSLFFLGRKSSIFLFFLFRNIPFGQEVGL